MRPLSGAGQLCWHDRCADQDIWRVVAVFGARGRAKGGRNAKNLPGLYNFIRYAGFTELRSDFVWQAQNQPHPHRIQAHQKVRMSKLCCSETAARIASSRLALSSSQAPVNFPPLPVPPSSPHNALRFASFSS